MAIHHLIHFWLKFFRINIIPQYHVGIIIIAQPARVSAIRIFNKWNKEIKLKMALRWYVFYNTSYFIIAGIIDEHVLSNYIDAVKVFFCNILGNYKRMWIF